MENVMDLSVLNTVSEVELVYKSKIRPSQRPQIKTSEESYQLLLKSWDSNKIEFVEQFKVILMNKASKGFGNL